MLKGYDRYVAIVVFFALVQRWPTAQAPLPAVLIDDDPRPLAKAAALLEQHYGWVITYEDPPYQFAQDIVDVTTSVRRTYTLGQRPVLVPKGGRLLIEFDTQGKGTVRPADVIQQLVEAYNRHPLPGRFVVTGASDAF